MIVIFVDCVITQINYLDPIYLRGVKTCRQVNCSRHLFFAMWKEPYLEKKHCCRKEYLQFATRT